MFRANYAFTLQPVAVQNLSRPLRVSTHRTAPQGSNTVNALSRISTTQRLPGNVVSVVAFMPKHRRADWSYKPRTYPCFKPTI